MLLSFSLDSRVSASFLSLSYLSVSASLDVSFGYFSALNSMTVMASAHLMSVQEQDEDVVDLDDAGAPQSALAVMGKYSKPVPEQHDTVQWGPPRGQEIEESVAGQITAAEALNWFRDQFDSQRKPKKKKTIFGLFGRRKFPVEEVELVHYIAAQKYDPSNGIHWRMLKTIYERLTGEKSAKKIGSHWETIGFQGSDPRTDVNRSVRCFALLQLLALIDDEPDLARDLLNLAHAKDWPLVCTSINFSRDALDDLSLRRRKDDKTIFDALHKKHRTAFITFQQRLQQGDDRFQALNDIRGLASVSKVSITPKRTSHHNNVTKKKRPSARPSFRSAGSFLSAVFAPQEDEPTFHSLDGPPPTSSSSSGSGQQSSRAHRYAASP